MLQKTSCKIFEWHLHTWLELSDTFTDALDCPCTLMAQDDREKTFGVTATQGIGIGMTHPSGKDLRTKVLR